MRCQGAVSRYHPRRTSHYARSTGALQRDGLRPSQAPSPPTRGSTQPCAQSRRARTSASPLLSPTHAHPPSSVTSSSRHTRGNARGNGTEGGVSTIPGYFLYIGAIVITRWPMRDSAAESLLATSASPPDCDTQSTRVSLLRLALSEPDRDRSPEQSLGCHAYLASCDHGQADGNHHWLAKCRPLSKGKFRRR